MKKIFPYRDKWCANGHICLDLVACGETARAEKAGVRGIALVGQVLNRLWWLMEKTITNAVIKMINSQFPNGLARKRYSSGSTNNVGEPDITGSVCGIRIEIEVKQPGKEPSKLQYSRLRKYRKKGVIAFWTDNVEDARKQLQNELAAWHPEGLSQYLRDNLLPCRLAA